MLKFALTVLLLITQNASKPQEPIKMCAGGECLTLAQIEEIRIKLENGFQRTYEAKFPGIQVKVYARFPEYAAVFYPSDKSAPVIHILSGAKNFNDPDVVLTGQIKPRKGQ